MVRITLFLLLLLLRNNAYAWYCNFQPDSQGNIIPGSMSCSGISNDDALQNHYCGWYRPNDPYCSIYQVPVCSPQVEYQTLSCPINQSGAINQSRSYECSTQSWTGWTTTSNNCTPDPPTCIESTETRTLTCLPGFEGLSQEQFIKLTNFFTTMPKVKKNITWKCSKCGEEDSMSLEGMQSFFAL